MNTHAKQRLRNLETAESMRGFRKRMAPKVDNILQTIFHRRSDPRQQTLEDLLKILEKLGKKAGVSLSQNSIQWIVQRWAEQPRFQGVPEWALEWDSNLKWLERTLNPYVHLMKAFQGAQPKMKLDIFRIKDPGEVKKLLEDVKPSHKEKTAEILSRKEAKVLLDTSRVKVLQIFSKAASCHFGKGTKWCISGKSANAFHDYYKHFDIIFIFFKKTARKWAVLADLEDMEAESIWNELDERPPIRDILSVRRKYPELGKVFPDDIRFNKNIDDVKVIDGDIMDILLDEYNDGTAQERIVPMVLPLVPERMRPRMLKHWTKDLEDLPSGRGRGHYRRTLELLIDHLEGMI